MCAAPLALSQILDLFEFLIGIVENPVRRDRIKIHKTAVRVHNGLTDFARGVNQPHRQILMGEMPGS